MNILVASIMHETNTFTIGRTNLENFYPIIGNDIFSAPKWRESSANGILTTLQNESVTIIPSFFGSAIPSGLVEYGAYQTMKQQILEDIKRASVLDGVCLALHGSMYAEGIDDVEGDLLFSIREMIGKELPIVVALDMHASMTKKMVESADGFVAYRTAPHTDMLETGVRAAKLLLKLLKEKVKTRIEWIHIPMLLCGEQSETDSPPMTGLIAYLKKVEKKIDILTADFLLGFPWADSAHNHVSVVVVGYETKQEITCDVAKDLATEFWNVRHRFNFTTEAYPIEEAISVALKDKGQPVVIADSGDNPTAGASEDMTFVLQRLLKLQVRDVLYAVIYDSESLADCQQAGVGNEVELALGRLDMETEASFRVKVSITAIKIVDETRCAVVQAQGVTVIITDKRTEVTDPAFLRELDLDPYAYKIIVAKSGYLFPKYQELAKRKILALTPGDTNVMLKDLPYKKAIRPIYPLDADMTWNP